MTAAATGIGLASTSGYAGHVEELEQRYEAMSFDDVHGKILGYIPADPSDILDVGAGSGRDAAVLSARGHRVVAAEPVSAFVEGARRRHAHHDIDWLIDGLPHLDRVRALGKKFDLILLTASYMHLDEEERRTAFGVLTGLLKSTGRLIFLLRYGPVPEGRRMFEIAPEEMEQLAERHRFDLLHHSTHDGRVPDVWWRQMVFEARA